MTGVLNHWQVYLKQIQQFIRITIIIFSPLKIVQFKTFITIYAWSVPELCISCESEIGSGMDRDRCKFVGIVPFSCSMMAPPPIASEFDSSMLNILIGRNIGLNLLTRLYQNILSALSFFIVSTNQKIFFGLKPSVISKSISFSLYITIIEQGSHHGI